MKYYLRFLIVPLLLGSVTFVLWGVRYRDLGATFVLLETAFQRVPLDPEGITELLPRYLPLLLFQIFYGTMIYRHFCTASVYFFSRKTNRVKWFLPECAKLWFYAIAYSAVLLFSAIGTVAAIGGLTWDAGFWPLCIYYLLITSLFLFFTTLAVNVLSILFTGSTAFLIVEAACLLNLAVYSVLEPISRKAAGYEPPAYVTPDYVEPNFLKDWMWAIRPNFIANLNLSLHSHGIGVPEGLINAKNLDFGLNGSVVYFLVLSAVVLAAGCLIVAKHSFIESNKETGGVFS